MGSSYRYRRRSRRRYRPRRKRIPRRSTRYATYRYRPKYRRRKRTSRIPRVSVSRGIVFHRRIRTTLKYVETIHTSIAAGAYSQQVFRANSIYDPNYTGTGHQPWGRDLFAGKYVSAYVESSRAYGKVFYSAGSSIIGWCSTGKSHSFLTSLFASAGPDGLSEYIRPSQKFLDSSENVPRRTPTISTAYRWKSWAGGDRTEIIFDTGGYPHTETYFDFIYYNGSGGTLNFSVEYTIYYTVIFFNPNRESQAS